MLLRLTCTMLLLSGWLAAASTVAQVAGEPPTLEQTLETELQQIIQQGQFPGATLAVTLPDGNTVVVAHGVADSNHPEKPLSSNAVMFCGSTGKTFVSAVALQLVDEGKLQLDTLASKYFHGRLAPLMNLPNAKTITVRSLMNHTSGLPRYVFHPDFLDSLKRDPLKPREPLENLAILEGMQPLHPVGAGWGYSDSNYLVLGLIMEQITGKTYYQLAEERLLKPLKLKATQKAISADLPTLTQGHIGSANPFGMPAQTVSDGKYAINPKFEWCGGGFVTNTRDLAVWLHALHSGNVLADKLHQELVQPVDFRSGKPSEQGYGLGSFVWSTPHGTFWGHAGIMPGYLTQIEYSQQHRFAIALQTNSDEGMGRGLHAAVQRVAGRVIEHLTSQE